MRQDGGTPLSKANVVLDPVPGNGGESRGAVSDSTGRFTITGIEPGRYRLQVSRAGYVSQEYGSQAAGSVGAILSLAAGQEMDDLVFRLQSGGVISGRVTDENGDPLPYVEVQILRNSAVHGTMRISRDTLPATTNDLGEYRVFDLLPGHYYAVAIYSPEVSLENAGNGDKYVPSFYSGANDLAHASPIEVAAGEEVSSIDFTLSPSPVVRVRGTVLNAATGKPAKGASVALQPSESGEAVLGLGSLNAATGADGSFEIADVTPGSYLAMATLNDQTTQYFARQSVYVASTGVTGLNLVLSPGSNIPGRVIYEGNADARPSETSVWLQSGDDPSAPGRTGPLNSDGTFVARNTSPGIYQVDVRPICANCYLKSAKIAGVDVLQGGLDLTAGAPRGSLAIVVTASAGTVDGTVTNEDDDQPVAGAMVVLVPDTSHRKEARLYKQTTTDQYGAFKLHGIAPGNYKVFAWSGGQDVAYQDTEFLNSMDGMGTDVHVEENTASSVKLKIMHAGNDQ